MNPYTEQSNIEERVADTILQQPLKVVIGDKELTVAPPSIGTLILASSFISRLPAYSPDANKIVEETLCVAKDCKAIGDVVAVFILGARQANEPAEDPSRLRRLIRRITCRKSAITRRDRLAREILESLSPREVYDMLAKIMARMEIADFFGLTTFLLEVNQTRPTKVVNKTTAHGRS